MKIYSDDGKVFSSTDECNAYEAELASKKQKEEADRKVKEEKQKELAQYRITKLKEINEDLSKVTSKISEYEKKTGYKIIYGFDYGNGNTIAKDTPNNSIDFAWYNVIDEIFKEVRKSN